MQPYSFVFTRPINTPVLAQEFCRGTHHFFPAPDKRAQQRNKGMAENHTLVYILSIKLRSVAAPGVAKSLVTLVLLVLLNWVVMLVLLVLLNAVGPVGPVGSVERC